MPLSNDAKKEPKEKDFFVDIKVKHPPPDPQQPPLQQPQIHPQSQQPDVSLAPSNNPVSFAIDEAPSYESPISPVKIEPTPINNELNSANNNIANQEPPSPNRDKSKPNNVSVYVSFLKNDPHIYKYKNNNKR